MSTLIARTEALIEGTSIVEYTIDRDDLTAVDLVDLVEVAEAAVWFSGDAGPVVADAHLCVVDLGRDPLVIGYFGTDDDERYVAYATPFGADLCRACDKAKGAN